jgi:hypothetical protein
MLRKMHRGIATIAIVLPVVFAARLASAATNVELIVDDSGSMAQHVTGGRKIDIAKQVLPGLIQDLPADAQIAVRTYGRQHPAHDRDCADMELLTPFGANTSARILPGVNALKPNGMTPIAASLSAASKDFAGMESQNNIIILLTDGEEDCNGDPCAASKALHDAGIHLQVNVIGFNVTDKERPQLKCIADAAAGKYYDAKDAAGLKLAASEVRERVVATPAPATPSPAPTATETPFVKPAEGLYGQPIHGGNSFNDAVPIKTGVLYHLDYHQPTDREDFFKVDVKGGQRLQVSGLSGTAYCIGYSLNDSQHQSLGGNGAWQGRQKAVFARDFADGQDGTYFFLVGNCGNAAGIGPDATFQLDFIDQSDAGSGRDAGSSDDRALEIKPGVYPHNNMNTVDTLDEFKFKADAGTAYTFKARSGNDNGSIILHAVDSDGVTLGDGSSPNYGAVAKMENLKVAKAGWIFVKVRYYDSNNSGDYSFALGPGDIDSPPKPPPR